MVDHRLRARRAIDLERDVALEGPGGEDHVGESDGVIGVEMREEENAQVAREERRVPVHLRRGGRAAHDAGPRIDEIRSALTHDRDGGAAALGVGVRCAGAEHHDGGRLGGKRCREDEQRERDTHEVSRHTRPVGRGPRTEAETAGVRHREAPKGRQ